LGSLLPLSFLPFCVVFVAFFAFMVVSFFLLEIVIIPACFRDLFLNYAPLAPNVPGAGRAPHAPCLVRFRSQRLERTPLTLRLPGGNSYPEERFLPLSSSLEIGNSKLANDAATGQAATAFEFRFSNLHSSILSVSLRLE